MEYNFICFSISLWEKRQDRKHRFMLSLASRNDTGKVFYIEPPLNLIRLFLFPFKELNTKEKRQRWLRALTFRKQKIKDDFYLLTPLFLFPLWRYYPIYILNRVINIFILKFQLSKSLLKKSVLWLYHPYDYCLLNFKFFNHLISCFDWAEDWSKFFVEFSESRLEFVDKLQKQMISKVEIVFTAWNMLKQKAKKFNSETYFIPNATDTEKFISKSDSKVPEDMKNIQKPVIGYVGSIKDRVDFEIITKIAGKLNKGSIAIIGNIQKTNFNTNIPDINNIHYLGAKSYNTLPKYIGHFKVGLIPYKPEITDVEPTKQYDYLACGIPVVSTNLGELYRMEEYIYIEKSQNDFVDKVVQLSDKKISQYEKNKYLQFAKNNSWTVRTQRIMKLIDDYLNQ